MSKSNLIIFLLKIFNKKKLLGSDLKGSLINYFYLFIITYLNQKIYYNLL